MNSEREILKRLFESEKLNKGEYNEPLEEKTYTVGDTQYWKRGGKCYKWTSSGGRQDCSDEEYMKAISGGNDQPVKNTEPNNDMSKSTSEEDFVKKMSIEDLRAERDNIKSKLSAAEEYGNEKSIARFSKDFDLYDKELKSRVAAEKGRKLDGVTDKVNKHSKGEYTGPTKKVIQGKTYEVDTTSGEPKPTEVASKKESEPSPIEKRRNAFYDDTESDRISYDGVKNFDHTTWDVGGYETTIQKNPSGRGYYLQNDDFDMDFDTKGDLVRYLRDEGASFAGWDSEKDY